MSERRSFRARRNVRVALVGAAITVVGGWLAMALFAAGWDAGRVLAVVLVTLGVVTFVVGGVVPLGESRSGGKDDEKPPSPGDGRTGTS